MIRVQLAGVFAAFCAMGSPPLLAQAECVEVVPAQVQPWDPQQAEALVGTWQIIMMNVTNRPRPSSYRQLELRLEKPDSAQHRLWPRVSLVGHIAPDLPPIYQSPDPMRPPSIVLWERSLQLGGFGTVDGPGYDVLRPKASTLDELWGEWGQVEGFGIALQRTDSGYVPLRVEPARGYFCAWRLPQSAADSGSTAP
jgi:hypothetical protein